MNRQIELPNFLNPDETKCKCGCGLEVSPKILILVQAFSFYLSRIMNGAIRIDVHSGARCPKHNADEGGEKDSQHVPGLALDVIFMCQSPDAQWFQLNNSDVAKLATQSGLFTGIGLKRYIVEGKNLVHLDCRPGNHIAIW